MKYKLLAIILLVHFFLCSCSDDSESAVYLKLSSNELTMEVGEKQTLSILEAPNNGETLVWSSSNATVATVFQGVVTALQSGTATITATLGNLTDSCVITIPERVYTLVWSDEFDGSALNTDNWTYETGTGSSGWGNNEAEYYTSRSENIRVEDGLLVIEAKKEDYEGSSYTSARIKTAKKQTFTYGKMEARLKVPAGAGTWPAYWMLGSEGSWPECGEIDIMEHVGKEPYNLYCALHTENKNGMYGNNVSAYQALTDSAANDFHIVAMEWVENELNGYDRIHIYIDGVKTTTFGETAQLQASGDWPFNQPFYFILNLAIGGNWGGTIDDTMFDHQVLYQIDYIRVYQLQ